MSAILTEPQPEWSDRFQATFRQIYQTLVRSSTRASLFEGVCAALVRGGAHCAWIAWRDGAAGTFRPRHHAGAPSADVEAIGRCLSKALDGESECAHALRRGQARLLRDLLKDPTTPRPLAALLDRVGERGWVIAPIREQAELQGALIFQYDDDADLADHEFAALSELASDLALALRARRQQDARLPSEQLERGDSEAVIERERRFVSGLLEAMPGIFYLYDELGRFLRWNQNFERVSGCSAEEIRGMRPLDFFLPEERELVRSRISDVFALGEAFVEASFLTKDGRAIPHFFTGRRIVFDGEPCLLGVGVDISERIRAEEELRRSEERYRTTLDSILEGCQLIDFEWRYLYLNEAAAVHNRRLNAELLGKRMPDAWPGIEQTAAFAMLRRCMEQRAPHHGEVEFVFADGARGWFDVRAEPVSEGIFVLSIDITERKRAELSLRELNEDLELKVSERTRDLEVARLNAEAADRLKSAFLATMSHELRTPLNSILGFTGIVLQGMAGPLTAEQEKQLGMVHSSARHLLALINDVLDISKIEAGQLEVREAPFDLGSAIERVAGSVSPLVEKKGLSLCVVALERPVELVSDRRRIEQVLLNLLNNAIKFTPHGSITLRADVAAPSRLIAAAPRVVKLCVADTGIGIDQADLTSLFLPFRQIDSGLQRQHEGTGLGLAICKRLVELLGGVIYVESTLGKGSVFTVELPMKTDVTP